MSSSLSSVILIGVVWLLIVTTLFVRRHSPVRRTSKALSETRVVHEGGTGIDRPRRRPLPAESLYHSDPDAEIELVDAEPEQVVIDDTRGLEEPPVIEGDLVEYHTQDDVDTGEFAPVAVEDRPDRTVTDDDVVELRDRVDAAAVAGEDDAGADDDGDTTVTDGDTVADITGDAGETAEAAGTPDADPEDTGSEDAARLTAVRTHRFAEVDVAYLRGGDVVVSVGTDDELPLDVAAEDTLSAPRASDNADAPTGSSVDGPTDGPTDDDIDYAAARRGRGVYDPVASARLAEQRRRRRLRVLTVLVVVTVMALGGAVTLSGGLWAVTLLGAALTGLYLYTLRKQTVAEQDLQRRRLARMRRARLGVRNTDDRELGVPDRLLRPGAVVLETDDADPEFAALDYADVTFAGIDDRADRDGAGDAGYGTRYDGHHDDGRPTIRVV